MTLNLEIIRDHLAQDPYEKEPAQTTTDDQAAQDPWRLCPYRRRSGDQASCCRIRARGKEQRTRISLVVAGLRDVWGREGAGRGWARWRRLAAARRSGARVGKGTGTGEAELVGGSASGSPRRTKQATFSRWTRFVHVLFS
jgi:hypothetical protein